MLPVHIDEEAGDIDTKASNAVYGIKGGRDIAHQYVHSWFAIFMFQKDRYTFGGCMCDYFTHATNEPIACLDIVTLKVVIVAFSSRPDNEMSAKSSSEIYTPFERLNAPAAQCWIGIDEHS